jgi:hypothetical protein
LAVSHAAANSRDQRIQLSGSKLIVRRRTGHIALRERRPAASLLGVALAVLALCLRLVWPVPPSVGSADVTAFIGLGEHALCLAASASADAAPIRSDSVPEPIGDHVDHNHSLCCLWHSAAGFVLPQIAAVAPITFAEAAPAAAAPLEFQFTGLIGPIRVRGPPALA